MYKTVVKIRYKYKVELILVTTNTMIESSFKGNTLQYFWCSAPELLMNWAAA